MSPWKTLSGRTGWIPWTVFALLSVRLLARVSRFAVDLPYGDQWDLWNPLFAGEGPWTFFAFQFGPVRQGLGGLVMFASAHGSGWSTRAETFVSTGLVIAGAALFMVSARRVRGRLDALDAVLPVLLLNGFVAEALTEVPNPAHGPVPFFLLCAAPLCFTIRRAWIRLPLLVAVTLAMTYTNFAIAAVPLVLAAQAVEVWRAGAKLVRAVTLLASTLVVLSFFAGYAPQTAAGCFVFPDPEPQRYLPFAALVLARPLAVQTGLSWYLLAIPVGLAVLAAAAWSTWRLATRPATELDRMVFILCGGAVSFAAATAVGRVCFGLGAAYAARYIPYVVPGLAAAALLLRAGTPPRAGWVLTAALLVLCGAHQVAIELQPSGYAQRTADAKRRFMACLWTGWTASQCALGVDYLIYPRPAATHLDAKVELLRARQLGPFRPGAR